MDKPIPSEMLIRELNKCRMREGAHGVCFEPIQGCNQTLIRDEFDKMNIHARAGFFHLSTCMVDHFRSHGLKTETAMHLDETKWR